MNNRPSIVIALLATASSSALAQGPLPPPPVPMDNPITQQKAVLGKILFWDEQLSTDGTMACGTCHIPGSGGGDPRIGAAASHPGPDGALDTPDDIFGSFGVHRTDAVGVYQPDSVFGHGAQATGRNSPSMIAAAYFDELFWDGRAEETFRDPLTNQVILQNGGSLESQSLAPILNDVEMSWEGATWTSVTERLEHVGPLALATSLPADVSAALATFADYPELFQNAFGTAEITPVRIAFALATYQRTLVPDQSKFDQVMRGQANFTQQEQQGFDFFRSPQQRCNQCHSGSLFADNDFHNLGLRPVSEDRARQVVTGIFGDRGRFKTPSLRNVSLRKRFFHTGAPGVDSLLDVVNFYGNGSGQFNENKDPLLINLFVPFFARTLIVDFLETLTDPRVANETFPFDRPLLWSERIVGNPAYLGSGGTPGAGGLVPQITAVAPPKAGNEGFRVGMHDGVGGVFAYLHVQLVNVPAGATMMDLRNGLPRAQFTSGLGAGNGTLTWIDDAATEPVLVGLTYEAQWWLRDSAAIGGIAKSEGVRIIIE